MVGAAHKIPLEVVATVLEMAELAWSALEHRRESKAAAEEEGEEAAHVRAENLRLRAALEDNLALLRGLVQNPALAEDCPPDLYMRLLAAADSSSFLNKLESLHQESRSMPNGTPPLKESTIISQEFDPNSQSLYILWIRRHKFFRLHCFEVSDSGADLGAVDVLINIDNGEPSWWVWVTQEMVPDSLEEVSGIDNENYVIISEENVVDGIADFVAKCVLANPKSKVLTPEELQKSVTRALGGIKDRSMLSKVWTAGKIIYALSTWGIALAGLYRHRAVLKVAAQGVHHTSKLVMNAL